MSQFLKNIKESFIQDFEKLPSYKDISCKELNTFIEKYGEVVNFIYLVKLKNVEPNATDATKSKGFAYGLIEMTYKKYKNL